MIIQWFGRLFGVTSERGHALLGLQGRDAPDPVVSVWHLVDSNEALAAEVARARRYERAFSIVVVSENPLPQQRNGTSNGVNGTDPVDTASDRRMSPQVAAAGLREALRENDILCYHPAHACFVLGLTESDTESARRAVKRMRMLFTSRLHVDLAVGVAQFPHDSLTLGDLIETARARAISAGLPGLPGVRIVRAWSGD